MTIFIPVLVICIAGSCEFMQARTYYRTDSQCRAVLETQKQHMRELTRQAGSDQVDLLEGTCIQADVQVTKGQTI